MAGGDERKGDDTHGLLRVVGSVGQRDQGRGRDLTPAETFLATLLHHVASDSVNQPGARGGDQARDQRGGHGRDDHLLQDAVPLDARGSDRGERGTDQAAEKRVRRAGRDAEQPGQQVPQDAADEPREDDCQTHGRGDVGQQMARLAVLHLDDRRGHRDGDLDREEGADQVQNAGQ
ncbi:Uncharacterised protein [Mycobacteroides abscessus subsp. massiliense]|nr:Uncharacterised protein [Mycobacteroides abscessus subsp. massiliense]